ncbi:peptidoglycan binding domain-containing protein [Streptomyces sp. NPDC048057]|uniref:peptidoglycan binding domain-containing protein n=1 Tax=Streptomyces sp. NPDC048057 TaxID=3155628 RepID=UPI0033F3D07C
MSRETDSSSSGPQGRGGAAYPSGTPPYGSRRYAGADGEPKPDAAKSEPKTETTITTRIRINIPGSRPIPPVVMRKPVNESESAAPAPGAGGEGEAERTAAMPVFDAAAPPPPPAPAPGSEPRPDAGGPEPTSDWFAPRKSGTNGAGLRVPTGPPGTPVAGTTTGGANGSAGAPPRSSLSDLGGGAAAGAAAGAGAPAPGPQTPPLGVRTPSAPGAGPKGPTTGPAQGTMPVAPGTGAPRMSDDTAVLTPQKPAPVPGGAPGTGPGGNVSGDTLTSGVPVVKPGPSGFPAGPAGAAAAPSGAATPPSKPSGPSGAPSSPSSRPAPPPVKKKGRSKLVLVGVAAVGAVGVAYGAGLLLNHSDVPKSTTVLGVDIGGGTREQAVGKLDGALGKRAAAPLKLSVGGKEVELAPDKAGLSLDSQTTVRNAAGSDYNPVSVIGSLFGGERVAEPVIVVDEEKLRAALTDLAGTAGSAVEGTIKFEPGEVVLVPGKAGKSLDADRSLTMVQDAYRAQVEKGQPGVVELPVAEREPSITQAELDRAKKEFADPAMSGLITVRAGGKAIDFGPQRSLPKILSMKAIDGKLVEVYDKEAIAELVGGTFQGVMITKGDGKQHQLGPGDIAQAMGPALRGKTPQERTVDIKLS